MASKLPSRQSEPLKHRDITLTRSPSWHMYCKRTFLRIGQQPHSCDLRCCAILPAWVGWIIARGGFVSARSSFVSPLFPYFADSCGYKIAGFSCTCWTSKSASQNIGFKYLTSFLQGNTSCVFFTGGLMLWERWEGGVLVGE